MKSSYCILMTSLLIVICVLPAKAALTHYTNRTDFDAAVGATVLENFNSYTTEVPFHTTPLDVGDFTLSMTGNPSTNSIRNIIDLPPLAFADFNVDGTNIVNVLTRNGDSLFITFDTPITAFGADFSAMNDQQYRTEFVVAGETFKPSIFGDAARFVGFTSDIPFTVLEARGIDNDGYGIDNVSYQFIPEPATLVLLAAGAFITGRKKR